MFCEEIRAEQDIYYISICSLSILYNSKSILMATSLGTNDIVVTRVHCINLLIKYSYTTRKSILMATSWEEMMSLSRGFIVCEHFSLGRWS